jgi:hypothetical protein
MCPFCMATVAWIAAGAVSVGGASVFAVAKLRFKNQGARERGQGESHDEQ